MQWLILGQLPCLLDDGPNLAVIQPNSRQKTIGHLSIFILFNVRCCKWIERFLAQTSLSARSSLVTQLRYETDSDLGSKLNKCSDEHWVSNPVPSMMALCWPWNTQLIDKKMVGLLSIFFFLSCVCFISGALGPNLITRLLWPFDQIR